MNPNDDVTLETAINTLLDANGDWKLGTFLAPNVSENMSATETPISHHWAPKVNAAKTAMLARESDTDTTQAPPLNHLILEELMQDSQFVAELKEAALASQPLKGGTGWAATVRETTNVNNVVPIR